MDFDEELEELVLEEVELLWLEDGFGADEDVLVPAEHPKSSESINGNSGSALIFMALLYGIGSFCDRWPW